MNRSLLLAAAAVVMAASVGCSKKKPEEVVKEDPKVFSIAATNTVVEEKEIRIARQDRIVRADFNMDNLEDIAVAHEDENGNSKISIYLRRRRGDMKAEFFSAGGIQPGGEYRISALMSRKGPEYSDLMVIFAYPDGSKEMVHYRSKGDEFREVLRQPIDSPGEGGQ